MSDGAYATRPAQAAHDELRATPQMDVRVAESRTPSEIGLALAQLHKLHETIVDIEDSARPGVVAALAGSVTALGFLANHSNIDALDELDKQVAFLLTRLERMERAWSQHHTRVEQLTRSNEAIGIRDAAGLAIETLRVDSMRIELDFESVGGLAGIARFANHTRGRIEEITGSTGMIVAKAAKDMTRIATGIVDYDGAVANASNFLPYEAGCTVGSVLGAKQAVVDVFAGIPDSIELAWKIVYEQYSLDFIGDIGHACEVVIDFIPTAPEALSALEAALGKKWDAMSIYDRGEVVGEVFGYIGANLILALASGGESIGIELAELAKGGSRIAKLVQLFVKITNAAGKINLFELIHLPKGSKAVAEKLAGLRRGARAGVAAAEHVAPAVEHAIEHAAPAVEHAASTIEHAAPAAERAAEDLAHLEAHIPSDLKGRVVHNPDVSGARVTYGDHVQIEIGPGATEDQIKQLDWHIGTARFLMRFEGPLGRIRRLLTKIGHLLGLAEAAYGTRGFEARAEIKKLLAIKADLEAMQRALEADVAKIASEDGAAKAAKIEDQLASVSEQLDEHSQYVDSVEPGQGFVANRTHLPEVPVAKDSIEATLGGNDRMLSFDLDVKIGEGRRRNIALISQPLDADLKPAGPFDMYLQNDFSDAGVPSKFGIYDEVAVDANGRARPVGQRIPLTKFAIQRFEEFCLEKWGFRPNAIAGSLAFENKLNFQREYVAALRTGLSEQEAAERAVRQVSFGDHRAALGYTVFEVAATEPKSVDLGAGFGVQEVPTSIKVTCRKP